MPLPQARAGIRLEVLSRQVPFSYWPSRRGRRHYSLQSLLFALDPWTIIERCIEKECERARKKEALACLDQARDFYAAATQAGVIAARPLALYYSFMNLAKAFCLTRGTRNTFDQAQHGLAEKRRPNLQELTGAYLEAFPTPNRHGEPNNFAEFMLALTGNPLAAQTEYDIPVLLPQIVPGHRIWAQAARQQERFIAIEDISFWYDHPARQMWLRIAFNSADLSRLGVTHQDLLDDTGLASDFRQVDYDPIDVEHRHPRFEQVIAHQYVHYPADELHVLVNLVRNRLWMTVATVSPFRRYYVYLCPAAERQFLLPQLLSIYAIFYYLGSITRYRPHHYDAIVKGDYGPRIQEFVAGQPLQFLYLMASEFARQDVTKPSIL